MKLLIKLSILVAVPLLIYACAAAKTSGGGPSIDGTWKLTGFTCNGVAVTDAGATASYTAPNSQVFTISGATGTQVSTQNNTATPAVLCSITQSMAVTYPAGGTTFSSTLTGTDTCSPAYCGDNGSTTPVVCGATHTGATANVSTYSVSGSTLTIKPGSTGDAICTQLSMTAPLAYILTKQ